MRALALPLLAVLTLDCAAAPFAVRLGEARVVLDAPAGFADTLELASPRLQELAEETVRPFGAPASPADLRAHLDATPVGRPVLLRELRRTPVLVTLLVGSRLPPRTEDQPTYLLYTTTLMLVRGKALAVSAYTTYRAGADEAWLLEQTQRWTEELQRLNGR